MSDRTLAECRVLIVEDEYMLADDLKMELEEAGAVILGPIGTLEDAIAAIENEEVIDGAILDVNLRGEMVFPVADLLLERDVPFIFTTGYDASAIPPRFSQITRCEKPVNIRLVTQALGRLIHE
ncbi:response regulator [Sphingomonas sp. Marseille-Q8236]|jgi:hypothetical protein